MTQGGETYELSLSCLRSGPLLGPGSLLLFLFSISISIVGRDLFVGLVLLWRLFLDRLGTIIRLFVVSVFFLLVVIAIVVPFAFGLFFGLLLLSCSLFGCFLSLLVLDGVSDPLQVDIRKSFLLLELIQLTATIVDLPGKLRVIGQDIISQRTKQGEDIVSGQVPRVRSSKLVECLPQGASLGTKVGRIPFRQTPIFGVIVIAELHLLDIIIFFFFRIFLHLLRLFIGLVGLLVVIAVRRKVISTVVRHLVREEVIIRRCVGGEESLHGVHVVDTDGGPRDDVEPFAQFQEVITQTIFFGRQVFFVLPFIADYGALVPVGLGKNP